MTFKIQDDNKDLKFNSELAEDVSGAKYIPLQATNYQPRSEKEKVFTCVTVENASQLPESFITICKPDTAIYGNDEKAILIFPSGVGFVVLNNPRLYLCNKATNLVSDLIKGTKLGDENVTIAKLLLAPVLNKEFIKDDNGNIVLMTLNLKSLRTKLIRSRNDKEDRTLNYLNSVIATDKKLPSTKWLLHLAHVPFLPVPKIFPSSKDAKKQSYGVMWALGENFSYLSNSQIAEIETLLQTDDVKSFIADPFRIHPKEKSDNASNEAVAQIDIGEEIAF